MRHLPLAILVASIQYFLFENFVVVSEVGTVQNVVEIISFIFVELVLFLSCLGLSNSEKNNLP